MKIVRSLKLVRKPLKKWQLKAKAFANVRKSIFNCMSYTGLY